MLKKGSFIDNIYTYRHYYIIILPAIIFFLIFAYYPMYGVVIAFKNYRVVDGIFGSQWTGLENFRKLFRNPGIYAAIYNTIKISLLRLVFAFPAPIILALLFNEIRSIKFKKVIQTITCLPNFMSWVVLGGIFSLLLAPKSGAVNQIIMALGGEGIPFLTHEGWFVFIIILTDIWQGVGWGSIIYLAVIAGIDTEMYEAAIVEGAGRFQQIIYITLPHLAGIISIQLIFACSGILNGGFDQILNMYNTSVYNVADILDTYIYRTSIGSGSLGGYSQATAVGLFKNVIGIIILIITNFIAKRIGGTGIW